MADETGFLDSIGVGAQDEQALLEQEKQRRQVESARGERANIRSGGAEVFGGLFGGLRNLIKPKAGSTRGVSDTIAAGAAGVKQQNDQQAAALAGITVDKLQGRRQLRKDISNSTIPQDGNLDNRIKMAEFAAKSAQANNLPDAAANALGQVTSLRKEKAEFAKLESQNKTAAAEAIQAEIPDVFIGSNTTPVAGQLTKQNGINGVIANGQFYGPGEFSFEGPDALRETMDQRWRKIVPAGDRTKLTNMITTGASAVRQYRRVLSTIIDLSEGGGVNSVLSTSGSVLSWVDNAARNVQGILDPILGKSTFDPTTGKRTSSAERQKSFRQRAADANSDFWLDESGQSILPEELRDASSAAQQHRAMVMELAYLAARMAEPSNRGLSDNDIKNAMRRIAGGTSNPQVMMRRFAEMTFDGAASIENEIDVHRGKFRDVGRAQFDDFVGGDALKSYRSDLDSLREDFGFQINQDGRAEFSQAPLDNDVAPGEGVEGLTKAPGAFTPQEDDDFLDTF